MSQHMKLNPSSLSSKQVKHLRSLAHSIKPLLLVGKNGITGTFIQQTQKTLEDHELVKVKIIPTSSEVIKDVAEELEKSVPCHIAQKIGKTIVIYNQREKDPVIVLPK